MLINWQPYQHIPYRIQCLLYQYGAGGITGREKNRKLIFENWNQPFKFPQKRPVCLQILDSEVTEWVRLPCKDTFGVTWT